MTTIVSYGAGKNSTAMIIAMWLKGMPIDAIVFSDTGNEKAETYEFIDFFDSWLKEHSLPQITKIRYQLKNRKPRRVLYPAVKSAKSLPYWVAHNFWSVVAEDLIQNYRYQSLGEDSVISHYLPAVAYGMGRCSSKWKIEPIQKWRKTHYPSGGKVAIGYHAGEQRRLFDKKGSRRSLDEGGGWTKWYPLIDWEMDEGNCRALCRDALGMIPPKSSCWFCPNARPHEVATLSDDLISLGADLENLSDYGAFARGQHVPPARLGRNFEWRNLSELPDYRFYEPGKPCTCIDQGYEQLELSLETGD